MGWSVRNLGTKLITDLDCLQKLDLRLEDVASGRQHLFDLRRVFSARFGEVGPASAAAPDNRRDLFYDLTRGHSLCEVWRHGHDDRDLRVFRRRQHDDPALDPGTVRIGEG